MVKGLHIFRDKFRKYADQYALIGGTACDLAMTAAGLEFRATKDLDIVLCIEAVDAAFVDAFWACSPVANLRSDCSRGADGEARALDGLGKRVLIGCHEACCSCRSGLLNFFRCGGGGAEDDPGKR